jgi:predicted nucleic acid-binding protein
MNFQPKRVYLDVCALCRPYDDQRQARVRLETTSVELILAHVRKNKIALIVSPIHDAEIEATADREERSQLMLQLRQLGTRPVFDLRAAQQRAEYLTAHGMGIADAAHLAFAEQSQAEFVTVDDRLVKLCRRVEPAIWCGTPLAYCDREGLK